MLGVHSGQHYKTMQTQNLDYSSPPSPIPSENARNASKLDALNQKHLHPRILQANPGKLSSRELLMLQQRKNKIVSQLEKVVGKQLANAISSQVRVSERLISDCSREEK